MQLIFNFQRRITVELVHVDKQSFLLAKKQTTNLLFEIDVRLADYNSHGQIKEKVITNEKILMV